MGWDHDRVPRDSVDALLDSWHERRPELDFAPVGVLARLARVRGHVDAALEEVFKAHDLSPASFAVLAALARIGGGPGVSQRRLMEELGLTSGTISVRMDRLVESGLVDRRPDPQSGRNTLITLTDHGRELAERVIPAHLSNERRLLAALTSAERDTLAALLRKLLVEFEGSRPADDARFRLGLAVAPAHVTISLRESVGLPPAAGLLVRAVEDGGAAAAVGIGTGDVLLRAGRCDLRSVAGLHTAIEDAAGSGALELTVLRGVDEHRFTIALRESGVPATGGARGQHSV